MNFLKREDGNELLDTLIPADGTTTPESQQAEPGSAEAFLGFFDLFLPLPYRILFLVNLGIWLWCLNLKACEDHNIDVVKVLKFPQAVVPDFRVNTLLKRCWKLSMKITVFTVVNYAVFVFMTLNNVTWKIIDWFPLGGLLLLFAMLLWPHDTFDRKRLFLTIKRVVVGNIDTNLRNNDILLADTLTSYNRVLVDFFVYLTHLFGGVKALPEISTNSKNLDRSFATNYHLDILFLIYPSAVRLRQCLIEYQLSRKRNTSHLLNAVKYSTAFLPALATVYMKTIPQDDETRWKYGMKMWCMGSLINASYSFIWDISMDWNFEILYNLLEGNTSKAVLRNVLMYDVKFFYYGAIAVDFGLRYIWLCRLLPTPVEGSGQIHATLAMLFTSEYGYFIIETMEILRRWVWVFIKVETEYIKLLGPTETSHGMELTDLPQMK
ncbi:unnamed protein product [Kuraishia capsulata CBS 1993]|uniref:EXS domain-containing protein n=1 Tax=Kuraishia capsulata CBS 1993 TaxID=1382522 RepID=W6MT89_9ASCO|nr:uncharacterized protein KUCA_T00000937001 [Kuraishia capsulata CBS 1993]CDK24970.1 unnamed protein product [Kuraishia capsulata CBS 1993]